MNYNDKAKKINTILLKMRELSEKIDSQTDKSALQLYIEQINIEVHSVIFESLGLAQTLNYVDTDTNEIYNIKNLLAEEEEINYKKNN